MRSPSTWLNLTDSDTIANLIQKYQVLNIFGGPGTQAVVLDSNGVLLVNKYNYFKKNVKDIT